MQILLHVSMWEKDEPAEGGLTAQNVATRVRDILADVTRSDDVIAWRVIDVRPAK
jgi:hypothetical protein